MLQCVSLVETRLVIFLSGFFYYKKPVSLVLGFDLYTVDTDYVSRHSQSLFYSSWITEYARCVEFSWKSWSHPKVIKKLKNESITVTIQSSTHWNWNSCTCIQYLAIVAAQLSNLMFTLRPHHKAFVTLKIRRTNWKLIKDNGEHVWFTC